MKNLLLIFFLTTVLTNLVAQNERFHGGNGDGFGFTEASFDMQNVGDSLKVEIDFANGQTKYTNAGVVNFTIKFNRQPINFTFEKIIIVGNTQPGLVQISGTGPEYSVSMSQFSSDGQFSISIPKCTIQDIDGNENPASININNQIILDTKSPDVEIDIADGQTDPASDLPLRFKVKFDEDITNFTVNNILHSGSESMVLSVTGQSPDFIISVNGILNNETATITIPNGVAFDLAGNANNTSINTKNSITFLGTTGILDLAENGVLLSCENGSLMITLKEPYQKTFLLEIYNLQGQQILKKELSNKFNTVQLKTNQYYLVKLSNSNFVCIKKIITR